jgi:protein-S-isoprenylcysteine O-methyltransferase Ste14
MYVYIYIYYVIDRSLNIALSNFRKKKKKKKKKKSLNTIYVLKLFVLFQTDVLFGTEWTGTDLYIARDCECFYCLCALLRS